VTIGGRVAAAAAVVLAFAAGYYAPTRLATHRPRLVFACPLSGAGAWGDIAAMSARARLVEAAALRHSGGTESSKTVPPVIAVIALGLPGLDPSSAGTLLADAHRRCPRARSAWAIVAFRRSGAADACCLDTIFVALDGSRWFVF
jgi:hypothetical protein